MKNFKCFSPLKPGDKVAVLSPSSNLASQFPHVYTLGIERLQKHFGLVPVEFPTTLKSQVSFDEKAEDLHNAFLNNDVKGIISCIGGNSQVRLIPYLKPEVFIKNPKPFFGFSDNTHFQNYLWKLGIPSFYGGGLLTQYAMPGQMFPETIESLRWAWFKQGNFELHPAAHFTEEDLSWADPENLVRQRRILSNPGLVWHGKDIVEGALWGGCLESLDYLMKIDDRMPTLDQLSGCIIFLETSEGMPSAEQVERFLVALGERGLLKVVQAVVFGRPKTWSFKSQLTENERRVYRLEQQASSLKILREYNSRLVVVQNVDVGHTDPQLIIPLGGTMKIDPINYKMSVSI